MSARAQVDVVIAEVEDPLRGYIGADRVAARGVQDALGFAGGAGGVEQIEGMLGIERLGGAIVVTPPPSVRATNGRGPASICCVVPVRR